ncbi:GIDE domain-containing protein [Patescibacteria group bacterium]
MAIGALLIFLAKRKKQTHASLKQTQALTVDKVQPGQIVKIIGTVGSNQSLKTPFTQRDCVYYEYELQRETVTQDNQGREQRRWEKTSSDKQSAPFYIQDSTGQLAVNPQGANIEPQSLGEQIVRPGDELNNPVLKGVVNMLAGHQNKVKEEALLVGGPVYAYGYVGGDQNNMVLQKGQGDFILSYKSEKQVEKDLARTAGLMKILGYLGIIGGVAVIVYSLF